MADLLSTRSEERTYARLERLRARRAREHFEEIALLCQLTEQAEHKVGKAGVESYLALDLAGTTRLGQGKALGQLRDALRLRDDLPLTFAGLRDGSVWVDQSTVFLWETKNCSPAVTSEVERRVFAAGGQVECPSDLRKRIRHDILAVEAQLEPGASSEREKTAFERRTTRRTALPDGMAGTWSTCSAEQAVVADAALDELVAQAKIQDLADGVVRTAEQRRADIQATLAVRLLQAQTGNGALPPKVQVYLHTPMATALGLSDEPGYLEGYGPISAAHVRRLLPEAHLRQVAVDERTGRPIDVAARALKPCGSHQAVRDALLDLLRTEQEWVVDDNPEPQYSPSAGLSRRIKIRDMRCPAPGCGRLARHCDNEHLEPHGKGGETSERNCGPVSRRCHNQKTHGGWTYTRHADGSCTWTSPVGRSYKRPAFWRPPPSLGVNPTLRPPDDPALIGHASPRGPTPPTENELARQDLHDCRPENDRPTPTSTEDVRPITDRQPGAQPGADQARPQTDREPATNKPGADPARPAADPWRGRALRDDDDPPPF